MLIPAPRPATLPGDGPAVQVGTWSFLRLGLVLGICTTAAMAIVGVLVVAGFRYATKDQLARATTTATGVASVATPTASTVPATERAPVPDINPPAPAPTTPEKLAPAPPAKTTPPPPPRKPPVGPPVDIREAMKKGGYPATMTAAAVESFVRFGTVERGNRFARGDQFDRMEITKEVKDHQATVTKQAFLFTDMEIVVPPRQEEFETKGLLVWCKLPLRIESWPDDEEPKQEGLLKLNLSRVNTRETWFLTKEKTLLPCNTPEEVRLLKQRNAIFYHPEGKTTDLVMVLFTDLEAAKAVSRGARNHVIDLVVEGLKYEEVTTWGYFNRQLLIEDDWDSEGLVRMEESGLVGTAPAYFRVDMKTMPKLVMAELVSATLKHKSGTTVASFKR